MRHLLPTLLLLLSFACHDEAQQLYAPHRAFLRLQPVTAAPPLHKALSNVGHWCSISPEPQSYLIAAPGQSSISYPITALAAYGQALSLGGFIIGTPQLPDAQGQNSLRAYDLACPSCYVHTYIARSLTLAPVGQDRAHCKQCSRSYDLNTGAPLNSPNDGQTSPQLYRYRIHYQAPNGLLVVQN